MGAANVVLAYATYAGKVPPLSMVLLAYMAVVSKDNDPEPWFGMGHQALAEHALGRTPPIGEADVRAVERAVGPLLKAGAIVADRRAAPRGSGPRTVRYRLNLRPDAPRNPSEVVVPRNPVDDQASRPTECGDDVPRNSASRPTESGESSNGNRGTEEKEETGGEEEEEEISSHGPSRGSPASDGDGETDQQSDLEHKVMAATGATQSEARRIIAAVRDRHDPAHLVGYLQKMHQHGDLARMLEELRRAARAPAARPVSDYWASVRAACGHGTPGGAAACALCRRAAPAEPVELVEVVPAEQARAAARAAFPARGRAS